MEFLKWNTFKSWRLPRYFSIYRSSPAAETRFGAIPCFEVLSFFRMDSVSLGIADDQTENWNFVSIDQFKI